MIVVLLSVGFIRFTTVYFFNGKVWISYLVLGAYFCAGGVFAYSKRGRGCPEAMPEHRKVVIVGSGPAGPDGCRLLGPGTARAPGHRGRAFVDQRPARRSAQAPRPKSRTTPASSTGSRGPSSWGGCATGHPLRRRTAHGQGQSPRPLLSFALSVVADQSGIGRAGDRGGRPDHRHRRPFADAGVSQREPPGGLRGLDLCHLRRVLLPRAAHRRRRWWRLRPGGGHLPDAFRLQGHRGASPRTSCAPPRSCRNAPSRTPRSTSSGTR